MKRLILTSLAASLPLYAQSIMHVGPYTRPGAAAEVHVTEWFPPMKSPEPYLKKLSADSVEAQLLATRLMQHAQDEEAFLRLCDPALTYDYSTVGVSESATLEGKDSVLVAMMLRDVCLSAKLATAPSREVLLSLRDILVKTEGQRNRASSLLHYISTASALSEDELRLLQVLLATRFGISRCHLVQARQAQHLLQAFRGGKEVVFTQAQEKRIVEKYPALVPVLQTERSLHGSVSSYVKRGRYSREHLLIYLLWQNTEHAIQLARKLHKPGYELLRRDTAALGDYLSYRGITYYRNLGQEVPQSCLTALKIRALENPAAAAEIIRKQNEELEPELRPLAPRCMLALGGKESGWEPVQVTAEGVHPAWPDASAVELPLWSPHLLGLADETAATVQAAFASDLSELAKLLTALREHHGAAGIVLAHMLEECNRVRPIHKDLTLPVYARIALHFKPDGLTVNYDEQSEQFGVTCAAPTGSPIAAEALNKAPQLLHRLTLQLALLEKHSRHTELKQACEQLARVLNRSNLWPLVICQRELRGFSREALLTLFEHYEGERAPLRTYGEAIGLSKEMSIAARAPEDELGNRLTLAAEVSAPNSTMAQRQQAADTLLGIVSAHPDSEEAADIIAHLLHHGQAAKVAAHTACPPAAFRGRYADSGLQLIRHYLAEGNRNAAQNVLNIMQEDTETDTTPAYRLACALLSSDESTRTRLRRDAKLLAMLYRHFDSKVYRDYLANLTAAGEEPDTIMKCELLLSKGRQAGISPRMAERLAAAGQWAEAAFCYEYLVAEGISTATPYGLLPSQADIYRYRLLANDCHTKAAPQLPKQATPDTPSCGNLQSAATPLAVLPARDWKCKNTPTLHGRLCNIIYRPHSKQVQQLRLLLNDGTEHILPVSEAAENVEPYLREWEQANGFVNWEWARRKGTEHQMPLHGKPVAATRDFSVAGEYHVRILTAEGNIQEGLTWNLKPEHKQQALAWCAEHHRYRELHIAATPQEALQTAKAKGLSVVVLLDRKGRFTYNNGHEMLERYLAAHPEAVTQWGQRYVLLPLAPPLLDYDELKKLGEAVRHTPETVQQLLDIEKALRPDAQTEASPISGILEHARKEGHGFYACVISPQGTTVGALPLGGAYLPQDIFAELVPIKK